MQTNAPFIPVTSNQAEQALCGNVSGGKRKGTGDAESPCQLQQSCDFLLQLWRVLRLLQPFNENAADVRPVAHIYV